MTCTKANLTDDKGLIEMFVKNRNYFIARPAWLPSLTVLFDSGYHVDFIVKNLREYPEILSKVEFKVSTKMSRKIKEELDLKGFVPVHKRWIVERTNSWVDKCKSLTRNFEKTLSNACYKLQLCFMRIMLRNLIKV